MLAALALGVALSAGGAGATGIVSKLPPAPRKLWSVAWHEPFTPGRLDFRPQEPGGAGVDAAEGRVVVGTRDGWLHALSEDGKLAWEFEARGAFPGAPLVDGDAVYVGSADGRLYALDLATGKERWRYDTREELGTRPAIADGVVVVASLADGVFAVDAATGALRWQRRREPPSGFTIRGAAGVIAGEGLVFAAFSDGSVLAAEPATGRVRWERVVAPAGDQLDVDGLALVKGRLFAAAYSGAVAALDPATGNLAWQAQVPGATRLAAAGGTVFVITPSGVTALSAGDGATVWTAPLDGAPAGAPALAGQWLLVPANAGGLRVLEAATGRTLRVFQPGTGVSAEPAVQGGRVYVLSNGGHLFALDLG
jgi:outer membrane protein assembly factor BamB